MLGNVYDVTAGRWIYQPGATYHAFAGRDASRAFVTGCFETHRTHDLRGLSMEELVVRVRVVGIESATGRSCPVTDPFITLRLAPLSSKSIRGR